MTNLVLLSVITFSIITYSGGWHIAEEILSGTFKGEYNFSNEKGITFRNENIVNRLQIRPMYEEGNKNNYIIDFIKTTNNQSAGRIVFDGYTHNNMNMSQIRFYTGNGADIYQAGYFDNYQNLKVKNIYVESPWYDLLYDSSFASYSNVKCRKVGDWIEFRGKMKHNSISGWPAYEYVFLPEACRPKTTRYTEMACHGTGSYAKVCNNDFTSDGKIKIHSKDLVDQQRFEGFRIWGGLD